MMRIACLFLLVLSSNLFAQIPTGYYDDADGKTGYTLKTTLHNIIKDHDAQSYKALWALYPTSDVKSNGKIWDMYSDVPGGTPSYEFTPTADQCGSYGSEGDCYNREHSFPKSWFNDASPMYTDPFHIVPTDGYVNGQRGNYPFGEVGSASFTSTNGSKVGTCDYPGYSGTVFEPIDEYKGDFARGYFYMATRYEDLIAGWETNNTNGDAMLDGSSDKVYETWALNMLIEWHTNDPVSQKELDRNDAIYDYQGNRNPFIDHPEYVSCIWESNCGSATPTITVTESLTDFGTVAFGNVSSTQSYMVSASNLTDDITLTASDSYQISETDDSANFTSSIVLTQSGGTVNNTTIFVRFNPTSEINGVVNGTITHASSGAADKVIDVSGVEESATPAPELVITESITDFGTVTFGNSSTAQSYTLAASYLTDDLIISVTDSYEISLTDVDADYTSDLSLVPTSGSIEAEIFVRFNPIENIAGIVDGAISHSSTGLSAQTVDLSGTVEVIPVTPEINFNFTQLTVRTSDTQEVKLFSDNAPVEDLTINVAVNGTTNLLPTDFTTAPAVDNSNIALTWLAGSTSASFDFSVVNNDVFSNGLTKNVDFIINNSSNSAYTVGINNTISILIEGEVVSGINKVKTERIITYPNPVKSNLNVDISVGKYNYFVMDLTGRKLLSGIFNYADIIDVNNLKSGSYILILSNETTSYKSVFFKQ